MSGEIVIPDLDPGADSLEVALALAANSIFVLPSRSDGGAKHPGSVVGKNWPSKSSTDPKQIAAWFAGTNYRVMVHCGRSGLVVPDVDHPENMPDLLRRAIDELDPPFQQTRPDQDGRGHYFFAMPAGRRIGNSAGKLGKTWGEVRGANGVVLVGGEGRKFLRAGPVPELSDYLADQLPDVGDTNSAVSDAEVRRFVEEHKLALRPGDIEPIIRAFNDTLAAGASRHETAVGTACWLVREAIEHRFSAGSALRRLENEFVQALTSTGREDKHGNLQEVSKAQAESEYMGIASWAVGQEWRPGPTESTAEDGEQGEPAVDPTTELRNRARELAVADRLYQLGIAAEAQRQFDDERRPPRLSLAEGVVRFADLAQIPPPKMLIQRLMPENAVGFLNGRSGSYKSFLMVAMAVGIATGKPVMGHREFSVAERGRVLYVAGEGSSGVALRLRAYAAARNIDDADVLLYPGAVNLASERDVDELYSYATDTGCTHTLIDTWRANTLGVKEIDSTEVGVVIGSAIRARNECSISTLYADHTGHSGERAFGSEAKWANVDFALMIHMPNGSRAADQQRTLTVEKLKDLDTSGEWPLRLMPVPQVRDGDGKPSAVLQVGAVSALDPETAEALGRFGGAVQRWTFYPLPDEVNAKLTGLGQLMARKIAQVLICLGGRDGLTVAEIKAVLKEGNNGKAVPSSSFQEGLKLIKEKSLADEGKTSGRLAIVGTYPPPDEVN